MSLHMGIASRAPIPSSRVSHLEDHGRNFQPSIVPRPRWELRIHCWYWHRLRFFRIRHFGTGWTEWHWVGWPWWKCRRLGWFHPLLVVLDIVGFHHVQVMNAERIEFIHETLSKSDPFGWIGGTILTGSSNSVLVISALTPLFLLFYLCSCCS